MNRPFFFQYDIPEVAMIDTRTGRQRRDASGRLVTRPVIDNPSDDLWRAGAVRITLSCWLIMEEDLHRGPAMRLINQLTQAGVRHYQIPFDSSASGELRNMALENIRREIAEYMTRAEEARREAETRIADESDRDYTARRRRYLAAARAIETRVIQMLARVAPAAERFGITIADLRIEEATATVELMGSTMRERARAFAEAHGILTRKYGRKHVMARGLDNGSIPPRIVADWMDDNDDGGENLRTAFEPSF